jgi:hypothetical protein
VYDIKVGKNTTAVHIMRLAEKHGWEAVSLKNNNPVIIRSADRIVGLHDPKSATLPPVPTKPQETSNTAVGSKKPTERKLGGLSAAAQVLAEAGKPLFCNISRMQKSFGLGQRNKLVDNILRHRSILPKAETSCQVLTFSKIYR